MLPPFAPDGNLPPGIHEATWHEFVLRFGGTARRQFLLIGLEAGLQSLRAAGCRLAFVDGSFVTTKPDPNDFDACWDIRGVDPGRLDPVLLQLDAGRVAQKARYFGEFFPAQLPEGATGRAFLSFFQIDKTTGSAKGIVALRLQQLFL